MSAQSGIEWTDSTWNPVTGCTQVSSGCDHCYALTLSHRLLRNHYLRKRPVVDDPARRSDPFAVRLWEERLRDPIGWTEPRRVFVNSMSDLFHKDVPDEFVRSVFQVMIDAPRHIYQVLTKRPSRMNRFIRRNADLFELGVVPGHIWLGTSIEDATVAYRADHLRMVPAKVRFLSCEPLLGPVTVSLDGIGWVIVGGESGINNRKMDFAWARDLRDDCIKHGVAFFFKQVGGRTPKAGGRLLDGVTWDQYPHASRTT
jgi:protein gp37